MTSDLDFNDYVKARDEYIMYKLEQHIARTNKETEAALCQNDLDGQHKIIKIHSEENQFIKRNGDTVEKFSCPIKTAQLATTLDICYEDIPLADGGFVKSES